MYRIIYLLLLFLFVSCGAPEEYINEDGYLEKHEVVDGEWHGPGKKYFSSGKLAATGNWKHGEMHGEFKEYFENGNVSLETHYVDGIEQGLRKTYFETGELSATREISNGQVNGIYTKYFKSGQVENIAELKKNQLNGKAIIFNQNGDTLSFQEGYDGKILNFEEYYKNGNIKVHGKLVDSIYELQKLYFPNKMPKEYRYIKGDTIIYQKKFSETGQISGVLFPLHFQLKPSTLCINLDHSMIPSDSLILEVNLVNSIEEPVSSSEVVFSTREKGLSVCIPTSKIKNNIVKGYVCERFKPNMKEFGCFPFVFDLTKNKKLSWSSNRGN